MGHPAIVALVILLLGALAIWCLNYLNSPEVLKKLALIVTVVAVVLVLVFWLLGVAGFSFGGPYWRPLNS